jgi:lysophospholipase L1-like esterase
MRSRSRPHASRRLGAVVLLAGLTAAACTATPDGGAGAADTGDVVLVVVGDSLTAGTEPLADGEVRGEGSWVPAALGDPLVLGGGWAVPGATTADMRSEVRPVDGDVLVLMAGTNDLAEDVDWAASRDNLLTIARTLRIDEVVVSAVPPFGPLPEASTAYNEQLRQVAIEQGWTVVDPWEPVRSGAEWAPGASTDGLHPTQEVADEVGRSIRTAVLARATGG